MVQQKQPASKQLKILLLLAVVAVGFLAWRYYWNPKLQFLAGLRLEQAQLRGEYARLDEKIKVQKQVEQEWRRWREEGEQLKVLLPSIQELPRVLGNLEDILGRYPLLIESFASGELRKDPGYVVVPLSLRVSGPDAELMALLAELEQFPHLLLIEQVAWQKQPEQSILNLNFALVLLPEG